MSRDVTMNLLGVVNAINRNIGINKFLFQGITGDRKIEKQRGEKVKKSNRLKAILSEDSKKSNEVYMWSKICVGRG